MEINSRDIKHKLEYSTVQFELSNPTSSDVEFIMDSNSLVNTPTSANTTAFPDTLGQQITIGANFDGIAYDSSRKRLISGNSAGINRIVDAVTGESILQTTGNQAPTQMIYVPENDTVYTIGASGASFNLIGIVNPETGVQTGTIAIPLGSVFSWDIVYSPTSNKLYVKDRSVDQRVWVISTLTNTVIGSISMPAFSFSLELAYSSSNNSVYVFESANGTIIQINCVTDAIVGTIAGTGSATIGVYSSVNNQLYYRNSTAGNFGIIDIATNSISGTTIAGASNSVEDMAYSPLTNHIWLVDSANNDIVIIDATSNTIPLTLGVAVGWQGNIVYADNINTVYTTSDSASSYIQQIDASGNQFYVAGSTDFNLFLRDTLTNPKQIDRIMVYGENITNLLNPMTVGKEDANGLAYSFVKLPNTTNGTNQIQSRIGQVDFENYIFDVTSTFTYTIPAFTTIVWIIYYKQYHRSDLLANKVMIQEFDAYKPDDPDTYDEMYLMETSLRPSFEKNKILKLNN